MSPHPRPHPRTRSARNRRPWLEPLEDRLVLSTIAALVDPSPLPVNRIETFDSASPGTLATSALVSNLQSGDQLSTIAFRPDTSQLYGLSAKHLYTVDLTSGQATLVGDFSIGLDPGDNSLFSSFKIFSSFDPFADAIREITVIETAGAAPVYHSRLINPFDASIMDDAIVNLQYVTGDVNQGNAAPVLRGFAYTNQVVDASFTRLYAVDSANNFLATLGGSSGKHPTPDNGQLASVGPLADVDALTVGGPADDAFALGRFDPVTQTETLLTVDLATGGTNSAGTIGGTGNIQALAVVPSNPPPFTLVQFGQADYHFSQAAGAAIVYVTRIGDTRTDLVVAYETIDGTAQAGTDYRSTADVLTLHAGEIARAIVLPLLYDGVPEPDENFSVMLGIPGGGAVLGTPSVAVVTLSDPQPLRLQMDVATVGPASPAHAIDVLANDTDAPGRTGPLTVVAVTQGDHGGLVSIAADHGPVLYTPAADFTGLDHFQYTARDDFGDRSTADVVVLVLQAATPPTAQDDSLTVIHDSGPTPLDVLANDRNAPGTVGALVITDVANGVQGDQVIITGGGAGISYRPPPGFFGTDTFTYTIRDSNNASATATVTVAVRPNNSIQGQVFNDLNGNGVHEPGEPGVDGWTIQLLDRNHSVIDSQVTHALDLNGDGTIDPETERGLYRFDDLNADNYAIVEVPQAGWVQTQPGQVSFGNVNTLTLPGSVATIAAGKFTSSSGLALLTTFSSPTNGQVNSGIAVFLPAVGGGNIPVISHFNMFGLRTASAVAADFNGDGVPDLALTAGNELDVILSQGYDFPLGFRSSTGNGAAAIVAADFNGDGHIDLAIADHDDNQVELFFNDGHGTFSPGGVMPTDRGPIALAAADFDGDGLPDLAVANQTDNTVTLFHNGPGGHFLSADTLAVGADPVAIQAAFLNGDSLPDLAVVNHDSGTVSVFLNAGQGRFLPRLDVPVGTGPLSLVAGDFNGDGSTDLVVGEGARLVVMRNSGDGHFATNTSALGFQADDIVAGDFNGDGVSDLAMASGAIVFVFESARTSEISVSFVNQAGQAVQGQDFGDFRNAVVPVLPRDTRTFGQRLTDMLYSTVFARNADAAGRALWSSQLDAGTSLAQVALDFLDSPEYHAREVDDAYQKLLGRKPDSVGRAAFAADLSQGAGIDQIEAIIAGSPEYFRRAGGTDALFVAALYRDVLGRKPDEKGAALWEGMLAKGVDHATVAAMVIHTTEGLTSFLNAFTQKRLMRPPSARELQAFHGQVHVSQSRIDFSPNPDSPLNQTIAAGGDLALAQLLGDSLPFCGVPSPSDVRFRFLDHVYADLLHRPIDQVGHDTWGPILFCGDNSTADSRQALREQVALGVVGSREYLIDLVNDVYTRFLRRSVPPLDATGNSPDAGAVGFLAALEQGALTVDQFKSDVFGSREYLDLTRLDLTPPESFLDLLMPDVVGRPFDHTQALDQQLFDELNQNQITRTQAALDALRSDDGKDFRVRSLMNQLLGTPLTTPLDAAGQSLRTQLYNGLTDQQVVAEIVASQAYYAKP